MLKAQEMTCLQLRWMFCKTGKWSWKCQTCGHSCSLESILLLACNYVTTEYFPQRIPSSFREETECTVGADERVQVQLQILFFSYHVPDFSTTKSPYLTYREGMLFLYSSNVIDSSSGRNTGKTDICRSSKELDSKCTYISI